MMNLEINKQSLLQIFITFMIGYLVYKVFKNRRWVYHVIKMLPRDLRDTKITVEIIYNLLRLKEECGTERISNLAKKHPDKIALIAADTGKKMTFRQFEDLTNRISRYFLKNNFKIGDCIGIQLENEIEYFPLLNALTQLGVIGACINTKLTGDSLKHILKVGKSKLLIYHEDFISNLSSLDQDMHCIEISQLLDMCSKFTSAEFKKPDGWKKTLTVNYFFTSGTTGNPKCVPFTASDILRCYVAIPSVIGFHADDVLYNVLPFYHLGGNMLLASAMMYNGTTMVIRKKFDAAEYFKDCCHYNATTCGFVGEMCRYLLNEPKNEFDKAHNIRFITGNAIRKSLIPLFKKRFKISKMVEYYGSTEGNIALINTENKDTAVGHVSLLMPHNARIVQVDFQSGKILRNEDGFTRECKPNEPGLLLGKVATLKPFKGYVNNPEATEAKLLKDIATKGDIYFTTGDLMVKDDDGFVYFLDRIDENYRWKGENVSVTYIEDRISQIMSFNDVLVYIVHAPQGKIGMAYIKSSEKTNLDENFLFDEIKKNFPVYYYPSIIKIGNAVPLTGTFKYQKSVLQRKGFNPCDLGKNEKLFCFLDKNYEMLTAEIYEQIISGNIEF